MPDIFILTGPIRTGKSEALRAWVKGKPVQGFITPTINGKKHFLDVTHSIYYPYEVEATSKNAIEIGSYFLSNDAFKVAEIISNDFLKKPDCWFVLDEIGKLELKQQGHHNILKSLLQCKYGKLVLVIREQLLHSAIIHFGLTNYTIINKEQLNNLII